MPRKNSFGFSEFSQSKVMIIVVLVVSALVFLFRDKIFKKNTNEVPKIVSKEPVKLASSDEIYPANLTSKSKFKSSISKFGETEEENNDQELDNMILQTDSLKKYGYVSSTEKNKVFKSLNSNIKSSDLTSDEGQIFLTDGSGKAFSIDEILYQIYTKKPIYMSMYIQSFYATMILLGPELPKIIKTLIDADDIKMPTIVDYTNPTPEESEAILNYFFKTYFVIIILFIDVIFNIDSYNGVKSISSGWDQYNLQDITTSSNTILNVVSVINATGPADSVSNSQYFLNVSDFSYSNKLIKCILILFDGSDQGTTGLINVKLSGSDVNEIPLGTYTSPASYRKDSKNLNALSFAPPVQYPVVINNIELSVITTSEVTIKNLKVLLVFV
jgi:hypothetical protein